MRNFFGGCSGNSLASGIHLNRILTDIVEAADAIERFMVGLDEAKFLSG